MTKNIRNQTNKTPMINHQFDKVKKLRVIKKKLNLMTFVKDKLNEQSKKKDQIKPHEYLTIGNDISEQEYENMIIDCSFPQTNEQFNKLNQKNGLTDFVIDSLFKNNTSRHVREINLKYLRNLIFTSNKLKQDMMKKINNVNFKTFLSNIIPILQCEKSKKHICHILGSISLIFTIKNCKNEFIEQIVLAIEHFKKQQYSMRLTRCLIFCSKVAFNEIEILENQTRWFQKYFDEFLFGKHDHHFIFTFCQATKMMIDLDSFIVFEQKQSIISNLMSWSQISCVNLIDQQFENNSTEYQTMIDIVKISIEIMLSFCEKESIINEEYIKTLGFIVKINHFFQEQQEFKTRLMKCLLKTFETNDHQLISNLSKYNLLDYMMNQSRITTKNVIDF